MFRQLIFLHDDGVDAQPGLEANLVNGEQVGGIGDRQEQAFAALVQWQYTMFVQELFIDQLDDVHVGFKCVHIQQGDTKLI